MPRSTPRGKIGRAALLALASLCAAAAPLTQDVFRGDPHTLYVDYALAACIAEASPDLRAEARAAMRGYFEYGSGGPEAYNAADELAHEYLGRTYVAKSNAQMTVMKCIDLTHGPEIEALYRKYFPARHKHW